MRIATEYRKQKPLPELTAFLKEIYHGGYGFHDGERSVASWADEDGIHIARGNAARYIRTAQVISWEDAAKRIGALLEQGQFATNVELTEAPGLELRRAAEALWYMAHDMSEAAYEQNQFPIIRENMDGGFPESTARIETMLAEPDTRQTILDQLGSFAEAWKQDPSLMRFRLYRPDTVLQSLSELTLPRREYPEGMAELPADDSFITEDEIDAYFSSGSNMEGSKGRIFSFWQEPHTPKEKADFLKNEYGTGGRNNALSGNFHSQESHGSKGITLQKPGCNVVQLTWAKTAKRIDALVEKDRYLTPEAKEAWEKAQKENAARSAAANEYNAIKEAHPDEIVLFQVGYFFELYGEDARTAAQLLEFNTTTRTIPGIGQVEMCSIPDHLLEDYLEKLRDTQDVVVASIQTPDGKHTIREVPSIDHEAERAIDAHEAEFGADGTRVFPDRQATEPAPTPARALTQAEIDQHLRTMFQDIETKRAVIRYMNEHSREKDTAAWLAAQYYGRDDTAPLHISLDGGEADLPWSRVQRRIV